MTSPVDLKQFEGHTPDWSLTDHPEYPSLFWILSGPCVRHVLAKAVFPGDRDALLEPDARLIAAAPALAAEVAALRERVAELETLNDQRVREVNEVLNQNRDNFASGSALLTALLEASSVLEDLWGSNKPGSRVHNAVAKIRWALRLKAVRDAHVEYGCSDRCAVTREES